MCSKIISDARALDETIRNDLLLRGSVSRYCRRAPGREIEHVKKRWVCEQLFLRTSSEAV